MGTCCEYGGCIASLIIKCAGIVLNNVRYSLSTCPSCNVSNNSIPHLMRPMTTKLNGLSVEAGKFGLKKQIYILKLIFLNSKVIIKLEYFPITDSKKHFTQRFIFGLNIKKKSCNDSIYKRRKKFPERITPRFSSRSCQILNSNNKFYSLCHLRCAHCQSGTPISDIY